MAMVDWRKGKRRHYSVAFKRQVLAEAAVAGVLVASVALRHGLNANLIFNWRRKFGKDVAPSFVPAVIVAEPGADGASPSPASEGAGGSGRTSARPYPSGEGRRGF